MRETEYCAWMCWLAPQMLNNQCIFKDNRPLCTCTCVPEYPIYDFLLKDTVITEEKIEGLGGQTIYKQPITRLMTSWSVLKLARSGRSSNA